MGGGVRHPFDEEGRAKEGWTDKVPSHGESHGVVDVATSIAGEGAISGPYGDLFAVTSAFEGGERELSEGKVKSNHFFLDHGD
jgi:hypothetical protein